MNNYHIAQVGLDCVDESGGSSNSIMDFHKALKGIIISFTRSKLISNNKLQNPSIIHIPVEDNLINRYGYTNSLIKKEAERILTGVELIICHGIYRYHIDWATRIAMKNNIPYWVIPHGSLDPFVFTYRALYKKLWLYLSGNKILAKASSVIFATEMERIKALPYTKRAVSNVVRWPTPPVDIDNRIEIRNSIRSIHKIPHDARLLLYIGRIHPMKRPIETIKAVAACRRDNLFLLIIGPDSDVLTADMCKKYCNENDISNVKFAKPVYGKDKYKYFVAADAFISLSYRENFGFTVAEAMSSAIPVILSPGNDLAPDISPVNCGWILPDNEINSVTVILRDFAAMPLQQLAEMGIRGKKWTESKLSIDHFNTAIVNLAKRSIMKYLQ